MTTASVESRARFHRQRAFVDELRILSDVRLVVGGNGRCAFIEKLASVNLTRFEGERAPEGTVQVPLPLRAPVSFSFGALTLPAPAAWPVMITCSGRLVLAALKFVVVSKTGCQRR